MPKDHYVPQFYLRSFEQKGCFWVTDKVQEKTWKGRARGTAKKDHFYSFLEESGTLNQDAEAKLAELEGKWKWILADILDTDQMPRDQSAFTQLLEFVAIQFLRTPRAADIAREVIRAAQQASLERLLSDHERIAAFIAQNPECDEDSFKREVRKGSFEDSPGADVILSLGQVQEIYSLLRKKEGTALIGAPEGCDFVTSDNPVNVWLPTGPDRGKFGAIGAPEAQIWVPLSPKKGLYIGPPGGVVGRDRREVCFNMNQRVVVDARRFFISTSRQPELEQIAFEAGPSIILDKNELFDLALKKLTTS